MNKPKVFICPRPQCDRVSDVLTYCRHGLAPDLAPGNWMCPYTDRALMPLKRRPPRDSVPAEEIDQARKALIAYIGTDRRQWIRSFELRTLAAPGQSMQAIDLAFNQLLTERILEEGENEYVRLLAARTPSKERR